jgi:hypothetical protein
MESEKNHNHTPTQTNWASASLFLSMFGCLCFALLIPGLFVELRLLKILVFFSSPLFWITSFIFGVVALNKIRKNPTAYKGKLLAILGLCISGASVVLIVSIFVYGFFVVFIGKPFDESHPALVISAIERNCDFKFPEKVENLKAAYKIAPGVDPGYVILIVRFTTNQKDFAHLQDSLRQLNSYTDTTGSYKTDDYPPVYFYQQGPPKRYKIDMTKGIIYSSFGKSKNNKITLNTTCVKLEQPGEIDVFIEGLCDPSLKKEFD